MVVVAVEPLASCWIRTADNEPHIELDFTGDPISSNGLFPTSAQKEKSQVSLWAFLPGNQFLGDAKPSVNIMGLSRFVTAHTRLLRGEHTLSFVLGYT